MTNKEREKLVNELPNPRRCPMCGGRTEIFYVGRYTSTGRKARTPRPMIYCWRCKAMTFYRDLIEEKDTADILERYNSRQTDREEQLNAARLLRVQQEAENERNKQGEESK